MKSEAQSKCLSDLALDRFVAEGGTIAQAPEHVIGCESCRGRLALFLSMQEQTRTRVARLVQSAQARTPIKKVSFFRRFAMPMLLLTATASVAVVLVRHPLQEQALQDDAIRIKGTRLQFFRQRGTEVTRGRSGDTFKEGDALRFLVTSNSAGHFFLIGIEPTGKISAYFPFEGSRSAPWPGGNEVPLPGSLVLDASQGTEYFLGIFSREPVELEQVRLAIQESLRKDKELPKIGINVPGNHHWIVVNKP